MLKIKEISNRLRKVIDNDSHLKEIATKLEEMANKEVYDNSNIATTNDE